VFKNGVMFLATYHHHHPVRDASVLINANPDDTSIPAESLVFMSSDLLFASALGPFTVVGCTFFVYLHVSAIDLCSLERDR
jgi:hypothetical protein